MKILTDQIFLALGLPLDARLANISINGDIITIETIEEYLSRIDYNSRFLGLKATIYSPYGNYTIDGFLTEIGNKNINSSYYIFELGIEDEDFTLWQEKDPIYLADKENIMLKDGSNSQLDALNFKAESLELSLNWNENKQTFQFELPNQVSGKVFQTLHFFGKAIENINKGDVIMFAGTEQDYYKIAKATRDIINANPKFILGIASQDIVQDSFGKVTWFGEIDGLDTSQYTDPAKQFLYYNSYSYTPGRLTVEEPAAPNAKIVMASVIKQGTTDGIILVRPDFAYRLEQLNDVKITNSQALQLLRRNSTNTRWENWTANYTPEAPKDNLYYSRRNGEWIQIPDLAFYVSEAQQQAEIAIQQAEIAIQQAEIATQAAIDAGIAKTDTSLLKADVEQLKSDTQGIYNDTVIQRGLAENQVELATEQVELAADQVMLAAGQVQLATEQANNAANTYNTIVNDVMPLIYALL